MTFTSLAPTAARKEVRAISRKGRDERDAERRARRRCGAHPEPSCSPSDKPGSLGRLAHYEVLEVLGNGGFGIVVKAFDEKLHRVVAIKVMSPLLAATSAPRKRFLREARTAAAVRHENVIAIYAVEDQPIPYLVMEFIAGEPCSRSSTRPARSSCRTCSASAGRSPTGWPRRTRWA